jgi:hypothetical protein
MHLYHGRANAIHPYKNLLTQTKDVLSIPRNPENPDSKLIITGNIPKSTHLLPNRIPSILSQLEIMRAAACGF